MRVLADLLSQWTSQIGRKMKGKSYGMGDSEVSFQ